MNTPHIIQTIIEIIIAAAIIAALFYEEKIVKLEKILFKTIKKFWEVIR